jgi:5-methylcytosine-specific restriction protein B
MREIMDIKEKYQLWDEFLQRWPVEKLKSMTLEEYTNLGNNDYFCYWLERKARELGGIGGGASFKFGIFRRSSENKENERGRNYSEKYGWYDKYGKTEEEAFQTVKNMVIDIIEKSRAGKFDEIDSIDLGNAVKWKIAFIYQDRNSPKLVSIYNTKMLAKALGVEFNGSVSELQSCAFKEKPENMDIFEYYDILESRFKESDEDESEDFIEEESEEISVTSKNKKFPLNTILYGPPGTGKTYSVIEKAVEIIDGNISNKSREDLVSRYEELRENGQIEFITFHQSYSYEDFIEGIKPILENSDNNSIEYQIEDGIFKTLCLKAKAKKSTVITGYTFDENKSNVFKLSLGDVSIDADPIFKYCFENGVIALGWGEDIDFSKSTSLDAIKKVHDTKYPQYASFGPTAVDRFINGMKKGDIVVITHGNRKFKAICQIIGDYEYRNDSEIRYYQFRKVKWLWVADEPAPVSQILKEKNFSQMSIYKLSKEDLLIENLKDLISNNSDVENNKPGFNGVFTKLIGNTDFENGETIRIDMKNPNSHYLIKKVNEKTIFYDKGNVSGEYNLSINTLKRMYDTGENNIITGGGLESYYNGLLTRLNKIAEQLSVKTDEKNYVLIIDEINRGNISKIFGELITLIEDDKRLGTKNQITTTLPYSKDTFGVPKNLYLLGTMNTADRSIALMDTALRRRFHFEELMPDPQLLDGIIVKGINLKQMLEKLNERVEFLYDRDHEIGHAYFLPLKYIENEEEQFKKLCEIFKNKIIPLLQEYFYDNYEKIQIVLGDHFRQLNRMEETENYEDIPVRFIQSKKFKENSVIGFDHEEYEDMITYRINPDLCIGDITPETFKKIYEKI